MPRRQNSRPSLKGSLVASDDGCESLPVPYQTAQRTAAEVPLQCTVAHLQRLIDDSSA